MRRDRARIDARRGLNGRGSRRGGMRTRIDARRVKGGPYNGLRAIDPWDVRFAHILGSALRRHHPCDARHGPSWGFVTDVASSGGGADGSPQRPRFAAIDPRDVANDHRFPDPWGGSIGVAPRPTHASWIIDRPIPAASWIIDRPHPAAWWIIHRATPPRGGSSTARSRRVDPARGSRDSAARAGHIMRHSARIKISGQTKR